MRAPICRFCRVLFVIACTIAVVSSNCAAADTKDGSAPLPHAVLQVHDFGAIGDGITDDGPAINNAIKEASKRGSGTTLFFPAGRYALASKAHGSDANLLIDHADRIALTGEHGAELVSKNPDAHFIELRGCNGIEIHGLTLARNPFAFTQGTLTAVDPTGMTYEVTIDPGFDEPDAPLLVKLTGVLPFTYPQAMTYQQDRYWPTIKTRKRMSPHHWRFTLEGHPPDIAALGKKFILWNDLHWGHGIVFGGCKDCLVEDVRYYGRGSNAGLLVSGCDGTITFRRFTIGVPPGAPDLISCSGGGQMFNNHGRLVFDDCTFDKVDDDGADIGANYLRILAHPSPSTLLIQNDPGFRLNDTLAILDWPAKRERADAHITAIVENPGQHPLLTLDHAVEVGAVGPGIEGLGKSQHDGIDRIVDHSLACKEVIFRNCRMQALRARPLNLKSQNTLIDHCLFYGCEMPAIAAGPEMYWEEAPAVRNLTIRNCRFEHCNTSNIDVDYFDAGNECRARDNRDILIEGNTFIDYGAHGTVHHYLPGCAVHIRRAAGVVIRNNDFSHASPHAPSTTARLLIEDSENVTVIGNQGLPDVPVPTVGVKNCDNVTVDGIKR